MHKPINGWTKEKILKRLKERVPPNGARTRNPHNNSWSCHYRADPDDHDSACCAVGAFIPNGTSRTIMVSESGVRVLLGEFPELFSEMPLDTTPLEILQGVHDVAEKGRALVNCLKWVEENVE